MPEMTEATGRVPLRRRRKMVRDFREHMGVTLVKLGKVAGLSQPMLSQFEKGDRDLSADAWNRVHSAMRKIIEDDKAKRRAEISSARQISDRLGPELYSGIERRFDSNARAALAEEIELIGALQDSFGDEDACPKTRSWLALEMEAALAQKRALDAAALAHAERYPEESDDVMQIFAGKRTAEGKVVPWRNPSGGSVTERISVAATVDAAELCLVHNKEAGSRIASGRLERS